MLRYSSIFSKQAIRSLCVSAPSTGASTITPTKKALMKLRKITGYSYVNCKKAVDKFGIDNLEEATSWLRELAKKEGWAKAAKLSHKQTTEGLFSVLSKNNLGAVVELNCQTDFVARGDDFKNLISDITKSVLQHAETLSDTVNVNDNELVVVPVTVDDIKTSNGTTIKETLAMAVGKLGENITCPTLSMIFGQKDIMIKGHSHPKEKFNNCEIGRFVSLVGLKRDPFKATSFPSEKLGEQICQHIIGMRPELLGEPPEEKNEIVEEKTNDGKDEDDINDFYRGKTTELNEDETSLLRQPFMLNPSQSVFSYLNSHGAAIVNYLRMEVVLPAEGPCTLGTNEEAKNYKCTTEGYYELVQCNDEYCVCVDPYTGSEAGDTRTDRKYTPTCGNCLKSYAKAAALNKNQFELPQCNKMNGKFEKMRYNDNEMYCVDENTGEKIDNKPKQYKGLYTCDDYSKYENAPKTTINYPDDVKETQPLIKEEMPVVNVGCAIPKDLGETCSPSDHKKSSRLLYFFDTETSQCLPFMYKGCGGNINRYNSASECSSACIPMDYSSCSGHFQSATDSQGNHILCNMGRGNPMGTNKKTKDECPPNYTCIMSAFFGSCCHKPTEDLFNRNYSPSCNETKFESSTPVKHEKYGFSTTLLGRECSDNFCPTGSTCSYSLPAIEYESWMIQRMPPRTRFTHVAECTLPPDIGEICDNTDVKGGIFYFFDPETLECYPMKFKGCKGNQNKFLDKDECKSYCLGSNYDGCRGGIEPAEKMCGYHSDCSGENLNKTEDYMCSNNYMLVIGKKYDHCCYKETELYLQGKEDLVRCMGGNFIKGTPVRLDKKGYHPAWLLGRSCDHDFCPLGTVCQQRDIFAYCCYPNNNSIH
uniref:Elongation factor Ts, mitochondrial n=1 Tax=Parastrongyloides trichosuri TaxID=131310 RepID=A0A0N4ZTJ0_PARTI